MKMIENNEQEKKINQMKFSKEGVDGPRSHYFLSLFTAEAFIYISYVHMQCRS